MKSLLQHIARHSALKGHGFIDRCKGNVLAAAPEAQCSLAPRFSVGKADSTWELRSPVGTAQDISCTGMNSPCQPPHVPFADCPPMLHAGAKAHRASFAHMRPD